MDIVSYSIMISILQNAALIGGEILRSNFKRGLIAQQKTTHQNLVTEADFKSQTAIKEFIEKEVPKKLGISLDDIGFIGEEGLEKKGKITFVIDPLDGTSNFASGFEYFGIIIGVFVDDVLTYSLIYEPIQDRMYYAEKGKGAYKKQGKEITKLQIQKSDLKSKYFSGGFGVVDEFRKLQLDMYHKLFPHFRGYISIYAGGSSICLLLENILGVYFHGGPKIWDIVGGALLVEEAGGVVTNWYGRSIGYDLEDISKTYPAVYCHPDNLKKVLSYMKQLPI